MNDDKDRFIQAITQDMHWHWNQYRQLNMIQWIVMSLVAVAGVLTAVAGSSQGQNQWFANSNALLAWGSITAIGSGINQFANPAKSAQFHLQVKFALAAIRGAVEFRGLSIKEEAEPLRVLAKKDPEAAIIRLAK